MPPYVIAGTDAAGRGPLAGPVVAAAADVMRVAAPHERKRLIRIAVVEIRGKCEC